MAVNYHQHRGCTCHLLAIQNKSSTWVYSLVNKLTLPLVQVMTKQPMAYTSDGDRIASGFLLMVVNNHYKPSI